MEIRRKTDRDSNRAKETETDKDICPPSALQECNLGSEQCSNTTTPTETALLIQIQSAHVHAHTLSLFFSELRHDDRGCVRLAGRQSTKSVLWQVCVCVCVFACVCECIQTVVHGGQLLLLFYDMGGKQRSAVLRFTQGRGGWGVSKRV